MLVSKSTYLAMIMVIQVGLCAYLAAAQQAGQLGSGSEVSTRALESVKDEVSKAFENIRQDARLSRLKRAEPTTWQKAFACDAAEMGKPHLPSEVSLKTNSFVTYRTSTPEIASSELAGLAKKNRRDFRRVSIAVWPDKSGGARGFWVVVELRGSAGSEFFENHFTDAIEWRNPWKHGLSLACRKAH